MIEEPNGNNTVNVKLSSSSVIPIASSTSNDDLSQSLSASEYTDADESMSAPTEYLAEVLKLQTMNKKKHNMHRNLFLWLYIYIDEFSFAFEKKFISMAVYLMP